MSLRRCLITALALVLAFASCATTRPPHENHQSLVWPEEVTERPRVTFVTAFSKAEEFGITKGFFRRLADLIFGPGDLRLVRPMAVVAVNGVVYVADSGAQGVHRFDPGAARHDLLGAESNTTLPSPVGLARGPDGGVYVTDSVLAQVFLIRAGAKTAVPVALPQMEQPTGIAFDPATGRLYVADTAAHRVNVFNRDGSLGAVIGRRGTHDGEFNYPTLIWRDSEGRLYVTDSLNFRVQVFDRDGRFVTKFGKAGDGTGDFMRQKSVATDRYGHVYIVDALLNAFQIFTGTGRLLLSVGEPGSAPGEFWLPTGIFISEDDTIYIADSFNRRIQIFRYIGGPT